PQAATGSQSSAIGSQKMTSKLGGSLLYHSPGEKLLPGPVRSWSPMPTFEYVFPAIRGIQAGREYYASMCPLRLIPRIFLFDEDELKPELRAQRFLNK